MTYLIMTIVNKEENQYEEKIKLLGATGILNLESDSENQEDERNTDEEKTTFLGTPEMFDLESDSENQEDEDEDEDKKSYLGYIIGAFLIFFGVSRCL